MTIPLLFMAIGILLSISIGLGVLLHLKTREHMENLKNAHKSLLSAVERIEATTTRVDGLETRLGALEAKKLPYATVPRTPGSFP